VSLAVILILAVILGYINSSKHFSTEKMSRLFDIVLSASVLIIVFTVGSRAGFILRSSGSWIFLVEASLLFSIAGITLSLLSGLIVQKMGDRDW
jgi:hypothetical protein